MYGRHLLRYTLPLLAGTFLTSFTQAAKFCVADKSICGVTTVQGSDMIFEITTTVNKGWIGFGFDTSSMVDADIIMLYQNNGKAIASNRYASSPSTPKKNSAQNVKMLSGIATPNAFIYKFSRPIAASGDSTVKAIKQGSMSLIWAYSNSPVTNEDSPSMHEKYGTFKLDLFSSNSVDGGSGPTQTFLIHGVLMMVAWSVLTTAGIYVARFTKEDLGAWWFRLHWALMLLALILTIVAFGLAVSVKSGSHFSGFHEAFGLVIFLSSVIQTILGQVINVMFNPYRTSIPWYDKVHWWQGRVLYIGATANVFVGIVEFTGDDKARLALLIVNGLFVVGAIAAFGYGSYRYGGQTHHVNGPKRRASENSLSGFTPPRADSGVSKLVTLSRSAGTNGYNSPNGYGQAGYSSPNGYRSNGSNNSLNRPHASNNSMNRPHGSNNSLNRPGTMTRPGMSGMRIY